MSAVRTSLPLDEGSLADILDDELCLAPVLFAVVFVGDTLRGIPNDWEGQKCGS
jgi:hypothetical protein